MFRIDDSSERGVLHFFQYKLYGNRTQEDVIAQEADWMVFAIHAYPGFCTSLEEKRTVLGIRSKDIIIIYLLGRAPNGCLASPDNGA
jgi:hypothetical protein